MNDYTREQRLNVAKASPEAVARHDKAAWLGLFSAHAIVEDPIGTAPHQRQVGAGENCPLARFYETYIAPNDIAFQVTQDIVAGSTVVRDVVIEITAGTGLVTRVPTYILYELTEEGGQLKLARLAAHWELPKMVRQVAQQGWMGPKTSLLLTVRMLRMQGLRGLRGYMQGFSGIGQAGKDCLEEFVDAVNTRDVPALARLFASSNRGIEFPVAGRTYDPVTFFGTVQAKLSVKDPISAGYATAFRFETQSADATHHGIGVLDFDRSNRQIVHVRFFWDE
jgi:hypothetical protein